ncbi:pericentriolar material 1 protein-like isoform X2 [Physella acuta]|uniref:pericentriolar material 1 protein-like isoform X2 n=1 Tax=Physella acuta TaxID=109671 RepID=UPI0027DE59DE|nr:pericentriolar material 1 protein-like isoform X2 [Physella acuta]
MASGGYQSNKQAKGEPKRRSNWQRSVSSDRDDAQSLNSLPSDIRINNWDLSDLRPTNLGGDSKRRKKSKGNPEREREQSLSMDSPPHDQKHHTPATYPRTKITPSTPTSQRVALENLKQHMTFSDLEDQVSTDGERNNERHVSQSRRRLENSSFNKTESSEADDARGSRERRINRNNNMDTSTREQGPDSNEIVARLMQIRDFMKQARSMLDSMEKLGDRKKAEDIDKVRRLIRNLQEQEQGYRGLLQNTLAHREGDSNLATGGEDDTLVKDGKDDSDDTSVDLDVRTENSDTTEDSQDSRPRIESKLGIEDEDEGNEDDRYAEPMRMTPAGGSGNANANRAADLENSLVHHSHPSQESQEGARGPSVVDDGPAPHHQELLQILKEKQKQLQDLMSRQEELNVKRRETEKKLLEAQARDNKARAALAAVSSDRQFLEAKLQSHKGLTKESQASLAGVEWDADDDEEEKGAAGGDRVLKSNIVGYPVSDDEDNSNVREVESLPNELLELKRQLTYLRNEFSQSKEAPKNVESEPPACADGRQQLENKLVELQTKKSRMDSLLQELQMLHSLPLENLRNNESNPPTSNIQASRPPPPARSQLPANLQSRMNDMAVAAPSSLESAMSTFAKLAREASRNQDSSSVEPEMVTEVHEKLRRLKEVRDQLDQLRQLVHYYQGQSDGAEGGAEQDELVPASAYSDRGDHGSRQKEQSVAVVRGTRKVPQQLQEHVSQPPPPHRPQTSEVAGAGVSSLQNMVQLLNLAGTDQGNELSDEDNVSASQSESQWSHLGPWDDDPEIQEKVKKLKAAKEKLRQLQDLVAFVQQSPDATRPLPEALGDIAASVEGEAVSQATQTDEPNVSISEGEVASDSHRLQQRDEDEEEIEDPRAELERLKKDRAMLLEIQNQLKQIQNQVGRTPGEQSTVQQRSQQNTNMNKPEPEPGANAAPVVTFASNDELYSKMRRQRILREELRSKKKELEAIMKKDRNKRQYSRNQDNQSDTVSLNTDTFGVPASVDATMATWGGSTVDNLENITEDEDGQERNERVNGDEDEDDGYPSDGIVQVEEEEEENDSDNGTYTIEADARKRKSLRKGESMGIGARPKSAHGRQTYPQPSYNEKNMKKTASQHNTSRSSRRDLQFRQESYRSSMQDEEKEKPSEWFHMIDDRLSSLTNTVEALLRKSETDGRQLSVSLNPESGPQSSLISPMQEQMLQLQNQSMMLSFSQLVQSLTRQQGEMQQLQQQMQALQLQIHEIHEHSFHGPGLATQLPRPALSNSALNNSNYNLQASAALGNHSLTYNHQMPSPYTQNHLNNTPSAGLLSAYTNQSPGGHRSFHQNGVTPLGAGVMGHGGLGTGLSINTGSTSSLPQSGAMAGFIFNPLGQSSNPQQASQSSVSTMTRDFSQFVNTLQSTPTPQGNSYNQLSNLNLLGANSQQQNSSFSYLPASTIREDQLDQENPVPRNNFIYNGQRNKKRKSGSRVKKSESDPTSGLNSGSKDNRDANSHRWSGQRESTADVGATYEGASFNASSSYSSIQSIKDQHLRLQGEQTHTKSADTSEEGNTLFDTLRDTIYAEVASLISQNESRPHFLLELFRDMRQIDSDMMRQRTLYSIQDLVNSHMKSSELGAASSGPSWMKAVSNQGDTGNSEQTPSESMTSDDEEYLKVAGLVEEVEAAKRNHCDRRSNRGADFPFDYAEMAENPSSLSTPTNGCEDSPFFQDVLGETVIEFDSLKQNENGGNVRGQGSRKGNQADNEWRGQQAYGAGGFLASRQLLKDLKRKSKGHKEGAAGTTVEYGSHGSQSSQVTSSSAMDQNSQSSLSDMPYPRIDMKQLDRQIKAIMMETIPVVKEHMDDVCSTQLLTYIKRLVLSLTRQIGNQEFARFFQRQLSSILQDTLQKYHGRKMRECGEDLLVEISDVLFNELAFFRLMQDLDEPKLPGATEWSMQVSKESSEYSADTSSAEDEAEVEKDSDDVRVGATNGEFKDKNVEKVLREQNGPVGGNEEKDEDETEQNYKIELAPSETKPFTRIGSDEDDDDGDEEHSMDDPSETAVSRDSMLETNLSAQIFVHSSTRPETEGAGGDGVEKQDLEKPLSPQKFNQLKPSGEGEAPPPSAGPSAAGDTVQVNGVLNGGHASDEELTVDDLPERLTVLPTAADGATLSENTPDMRCKFAEEQRNVCGIDAILTSLDGLEELAGGDLLDPDAFFS